MLDRPITALPREWVHAMIAFRIGTVLRPVLSETWMGPECLGRTGVRKGRWSLGRYSAESGLDVVE